MHQCMRKDHIVSWSLANALVIPSFIWNAHCWITSMGFPVLALNQDWLFKRCRQAQYMRPDTTRVSDTTIMFLTWFTIWLGLKEATVLKQDVSWQWLRGTRQWNRKRLSQYKQSPWDTHSVSFVKKTLAHSAGVPSACLLRPGADLSAHNSGQ